MGNSHGQKIFVVNINIENMEFNNIFRVYIKPHIDFPRAFDAHPADTSDKCNKMFQSRKLL